MGWRALHWPSLSSPRCEERARTATPPRGAAQTCTAKLCTVTTRARRAPLRLPKPPVPRPSPRTTLAAAPSPLLRGMSRPRWAALRHAARRSSGGRWGGAARGVAPKGLLFFLSAREPGCSELVADAPMVSATRAGDFVTFASERSVNSASRRRSFQPCAVDAERNVDVATRGVRVRAARVGSAHEVLGVDT